MPLYILNTVKFDGVSVGVFCQEMHFCQITAINPKDIDGNGFKGFSVL